MSRSTASTTKPLAFDTGAASISLPLGMAVELGLKPSKGEDVMRAGGRRQDRQGQADDDRAP